jgi:hypothetical protein
MEKTLKIKDEIFKIININGHWIDENKRKWIHLTRDVWISNQPGIDSIIAKEVKYSYE